MAPYSAAESLHRLVKEAIDSGAAASLSEATEMFKRFRIRFEVSDDEARNPHCQAALLTGVALARRVFLGGVQVNCSTSVPIIVPLPLGSTLGEAVQRLGAQVGDCPPGDPLVTIGTLPKERSSQFNVRTVFGGWRGGIVPAYSPIRVPTEHTVPLAPMLAAALAVNEAFSFVRTGNSAFGRRSTGLSLWRPSSLDWIDRAVDEPELVYLPSRLWLIGLGHLGQAYLWGLGLLPYRNPSDVSLVLQDTDVITPASESTSVLTDEALIGQKKTRAMAAWSERRGFTTLIQEREFKADFRRQPNEPAVALCGVDNAVARQALDQVGFDLVVEAGLGRGYRDFRSMRLHTLPGPRASSTIWSSTDQAEQVEMRPAYQSLLHDATLDRCGVTLLAGKAVGAPFVGSVAACLALSEVLRHLHGGPLHELLDLDLQALAQRSVVVHPSNFTHLNPGYVYAG